MTETSLSPQDFDPHVHVRRGTTEDIKTCGEVESACFPASKYASAAAFDSLVSSFPDGFLVGEVTRRADSVPCTIGFLYYGLDNSATVTWNADDMAVDGKDVKIVCLSIRPEFQHHKQRLRNWSAGSALVRSLLHELHDKHPQAERVWALVPRNVVPFYEQLGFEHNPLYDNAAEDRFAVVLTRHQEQEEPLPE